MNFSFASIVSLVHPTNPLRLKITNNSFYHMASVLWNRLPADLGIRSQCTKENHFTSPSPYALPPSQPNSNLISSIIPFLLDFFLLCWTDSPGLRLGLGFFVSFVTFVHLFHHFTLITFLCDFIYSV